MRSKERFYKFFFISIAFSVSLITPYILRAEVIPGGPLDEANMNTTGRRIDWDPGVRGGIISRPACSVTLSATATTQDIQAALDNPLCKNKAVELAQATYTINATLKIPSYVTLRGKGMNLTILKGASTFSGDAMVTFDSSFDESWSSAAKTLSSPKKGDTTITTTAAHGWKGESTVNGVFTPGDVVLIDMLEQPTGNPPIDAHGSLGACSWCGREAGTRPVGQWVYIKSVPSTTTAIIDPPLYWNYKNTPQGTKMAGLTHQAGVEDLTLNNLTSKTKDTVTAFGAINSWLLRVGVQGSNRRAFWGFGALWFNIQGCKIWSGIPEGTDEALPSIKQSGGTYISDRSYGIFLGPHFTAGLFTDNIFEKLTMAIAYEGAASGNVFSYNYIGQMWWNRTENSGKPADQPRRFGPLMHGPHPFMNLIEGNISEERFRADEYWGTSSHFTLLRNRIKQRHREPAGSTSWSMPWLLDIERRNWYYNIVGNVLGDTGTETKYELYNESFSYEGGPQAIYKLGYPSLGDTANEAGFDSNVKATLRRHGNWVPVRVGANTGPGIEAATACNEQTDLTCVIPSSYYLSARPNWFKDNSGNDLRWPPIDPKNAARMECPIPAQLRFAPGTTVPTECRTTSTNGPVPPTNLRVN